MAATPARCAVNMVRMYSNGQRHQDAEVYHRWAPRRLLVTNSSAISVGPTPWSRTLAIRTPLSSHGWNQVPLEVVGAITVAKTSPEITQPVVAAPRRRSGVLPGRIAEAVRVAAPRIADQTVK